VTPAVGVLIAASILFVYPFALYPVVLAALTRRRNRIAPVPVNNADPPSIALVTCALNEDRVIREKVENCLTLDYPRNKLRVIFVSDGSTDRTASIISEYCDQGVELIARERRRGKVSNLNDVIPSLVEEIVALSDANVIYDAKALKNLVARFADPTVGCASGKVVLRDTTEEFRSSEEGYYSLEWGLQEMASELYSMAGADGAMYAFRRELFAPPPNDTLIEDFVIPMGVVRQGRRVVFTPSALAWEEGPGSLREEYRRKVRIAAGAAQALIRGNGWPVSAPVRFWLIFVSHKLLRWLSPITGLMALAAAAAAWRHPLSQLAVAGFFAIAGLAVIRAATGWKSRFLSAPFYFLFGQVAILHGLIKGASGRQSVLWAKVKR
jgi:cellulose synthase/poly-beta-1,6-N-acetylglucosamine synthase-like glycosyltransferase